MIARAHVAAALVALLLLAAPSSAQRSLNIERFEAEIALSADGTIRVEETIVPRFTGSWNGIYRSIPVQYRTPQGLNYTLRLNVESVTDGEGRPLEYENSRERHYRKLKIWVPGATDTRKTVVLTYRVSNALRFFDEHDELYWNVTGDEWDVPIESAAAHIRLPSGITGVRATAFRGAHGSTEQSEVRVEPEGIRVSTSRPLGFREGLTLVAGWNPGLVQRPTAVERTAGVVSSNMPLALPPLVLFGMYRLWRARGRDPELLPIATQYEPPDGMSPAELGTLIDGTPDMRDITATLVDLAVRGYVHITETEDEALFGLITTEDYRFELKRPASEWAALKSHERHLLASMFGSSDAVTLSSLKNTFYTKLPALKSDLYGMLVRHGFYAARPDHVRAWYVCGGIAVGVVIGFASAFVLDRLGMQPAAGVLAGVLSGAVIVVFGFFMPARTVRGTRELEKVRGFEEFLGRVEGDRLQRVAATPEMFERFLPYAMALGVEETWAKKFEGIAHTPPQWYSGRYGTHGFRPAAFTNSLGAMSTKAASTMASAPRSSGGSGFRGGSSGGGFGGGGGGGF